MPVDIQGGDVSVSAAPPIGRAVFAALLIERNLISSQDLARAEEHAQGEGLELSEAVVLLGLLPEDECYGALATAAGLTLVDLSTVEPSALALQLVPERLARRHAVVPLSVDNRTLTYATCRPFDPEIEPDLSFASGRRMQATVAPRAVLLSLLDRCYPKPGDLAVLAARLSAERPLVAAVEKEDTPPPSAAVDLCNQVVERAVEFGASYDSETPGATARAIRAAMRASGAPTMRDRALQLVAEVMTSMEEVHRVLGADAEPMPGGARKGLRVLVADDDAITRLLVRTLLERENFEVLEATNGREAVDVAISESPGLLLIDLNMPVVDGYEAIAAIRRKATLASLPILVLTGEDGPGIEGRVLALGADDYILKPFEPAILLSRVNAVFRRLKVAAA
jgi:CheY-like chemotaxis protein